MSATDGRSDGTESTLDELPEFELRYLLDDADRPQTVTVYAPTSLETAWLTVDCETTVSLADVR